MIRAAAACTILFLRMAAAPAADLFYMDRDSFSNEYVGPVGPLVLSGEIVPGDYHRLLSRIAEDEKRFLDQNKLILASSDGNATEAMKIAKLLKSLYTAVVVGPLTGRCSGACFLIYAAAAERGTDGQNLLGIRRPGLAESEWAAMPTTQAALLEDGIQGPARDFLVENEVPGELVEEFFKRPATDVYWLSETDEVSLGSKSPSFQKYLAKNCAWNDALEQAVYKGERTFDDLKQVAACRARVTRSEAHKALAQALKEESAPSENSRPQKASPSSKAPKSQHAPRSPSASAAQAAPDTPPD
jgi:hypothetical protein